MSIGNSLSIIDAFHSDLKFVKELVYDKCNLVLTDLMLSSESEAYGACSYKLKEKVIQHRSSKITPTKTGQFVTIWKRNKDGITEPFNVSDEIDFIIITARSNNNFGQFIFPKSVLVDKGVITRKGREGKRGIRVYPPWDEATNKQAKKTQTWQIRYFLTIGNDMAIDFDLMKRLFA